MANYRKNVLVGGTMIVALALLAVMILLFGEAPVRLFSTAQMQVKFVADSADGITNGSPILYLGVNVGQVRSVDLLPNQPGVTILGTVAQGRAIPANVEGVVRSTLIGGNASLSLETIGGAAPQGKLETNATIHTHVGGTNLLPREFAELAKQLTELSRRLQTTVDDWNNSKLVSKLAATVDTTQKTITKIGETSDELRKLLADGQLRGDLKDTLANFKAVSENSKSIAKNLEKLSLDLQKTNASADATITKAGTRIDELSKQVGGRLDQVAGVLERFQSMANKIDKGEGSAGKFINDPKLYEALVDTSQELNLTVKDLRRLIEQWEQEGVSLKLGGKK
jgi:phospholipid/cholesterol/gamma-HCH transport system substrate-binding protein